MLVLSRKVGERIVVGDNITITVVRMGQGSVRIGIEAPGDMTIVREELLTGGQKLPSIPTEHACQEQDCTEHEREEAPTEVRLAAHCIEMCDVTVAG